MSECLVDVLNAHDTVLHVFPVKVEDRNAVSKEAECIQQALQTAHELQLVPESEAESLHARVHVSRGGPLTPFGDVLEIRRQAQARAEEHRRTHAYFLWQQAGCPDNQADSHWHRASEA